MIKSMILAALLMVAPGVYAEALPTDPAEIMAVWAEGKMQEATAREKMRTELTPTPMEGPGQYLGVNIHPCSTPDGFQYGVNWPVFTEQEKGMWVHVMATQGLEEQKKAFAAMIHGTEMLWDIAKLSQETKDNLLTRMKLIQRDCFPEPTGA